MSQSTKRKRKSNLLKEGGLCFWCVKPVVVTNEPIDEQATIDHLVHKSDPLRKEKLKVMKRNTVLAHRLCNEIRGHLDQATFGLLRK